jgi:hypothetical protein
MSPLLPSTNELLRKQGGSARGNGFLNTWKKARFASPASSQSRLRRIGLVELPVGLLHFICHGLAFLDLALQKPAAEINVAVGLAARASAFKTW